MINDELIVKGKSSSESCWCKKWLFVSWELSYFFLKSRFWLFSLFLHRSWKLRQVPTETVNFNWWEDKKKRKSIPFRFVCSLQFAFNFIFLFVISSPKLLFLVDQIKGKKNLMKNLMLVDYLWYFLRRVRSDWNVHFSCPRSPHFPYTSHIPPRGFLFCFFFWLFLCCFFLLLADKKNRKTFLLCWVFFDIFLQIFLYRKNFF
jgi:hypothetical protein